MKSFFMFCIIAMMLATLGCDEKKSSPVGSNVIDRNDFGQFGEVHLRPADQDTTIQVSSSTNTGPLLLVGEWNGYQTKSLLKFDSLPDIDSVISASLTLITFGVIDTETTVDTVQMVLSLLESEWEEDEVNFDTHPNSSVIKTLNVGRSIDDTLTFPLPVDTVQGWIDGTMDNYGFLLSYDEQGEGFIKKFYSSNSQTGPPTLNINWALTDTSDTTVSRIPTADVFVVNRCPGRHWPFDDGRPDRLMVGNGFVYRSLLQFDIEDSIPDGATILRGDLTLYIDDEYSFFSSLDIGIYAVTSQTWDTPEFYPVQIIWAKTAQDADSVVFSIYSLIQDWVDGERPNYGLMVRSFSENWDISSFVFHSSSSDPTRTPRLDVSYGTPPDFGPKNIVETPFREQ